jgi:hypothetical protein
MVHNLLEPNNHQKAARNGGFMGRVRAYSAILWANRDREKTRIFNLQEEGVVPSGESLPGCSGSAIPTRGERARSLPGSGSEKK